MSTLVETRGSQWTRKYLADGDNPRSLAGRARRQRWLRFIERFPEIEEMRVLDLGGTPPSWLFSGLRPLEVVLLNRRPAPSEHPWLRVVEGDACAPPTWLQREAFDLVFSNSVIDQVGGHTQRLAFADVVRTMAPKHWVQTAYRYFPLDAHFLFPGFASLPLAARALVAQRWLRRRLDHQRAVALVLQREPLTATHMRYYFPDSELLRERVLGLTKSLIAVA
jgi:hypothetical protein